MNSLLTKKSNFIKTIRQFFYDKGVIEVFTPLLWQAATTDPKIEPITASVANHLGYLQTSPEMLMKLLLVKYQQDIFQICSAFRDHEFGKIHRYEFQILEWYRIGFSLDELIRECIELLRLFLSFDAVITVPFVDAFSRFAGYDYKNSSLDSALQFLKTHNIVVLNQEALDLDDLHDMIFSSVVQPNMPKQCIVVINEFPKDQAVLAKTFINKDLDEVASRFELFFNGIELANGFHELNDLGIYQQRITEDNLKRQSLGLKCISPDEEFIKKFNDIPDSSGVALGLDRIFMLHTESSELSKVLDFNLRFE